MGLPQALEGLGTAGTGGAACTRRLQRLLGLQQGCLKQRSCSIQRSLDAVAAGGCSTLLWCCNRTATSISVLPTRKQHWAHNKGLPRQLDTVVLRQRMQQVQQIRQSSKAACLKHKHTAGGSQQ